MAPFVVLAVADAATFPAILAPLVVLADADAAAFPATVAPLVVLALLVDAPLDWMRRRGIMRCYGSCLFHAVNGDGGEL